jgi:hypothetical protein
MAKEKKPSSESVPKAPRKSAAKKAAAAPAKSAAKKIAKPAAAPAPPLTAGAADLHEQIRQLAYQYYCERGGLHGAHDEDWLRAELEVLSRYGR